MKREKRETEQKSPEERKTPGVAEDTAEASPTVADTPGACADSGSPRNSGGKSGAADAQSADSGADHPADSASDAPSPEDGAVSGGEVYTFTRSQVDQMELAVKQLDSLKDQLLRLTAEYDNYRKRTAREKEALWQDAKIDTIQKFLPVYDNLERASAAKGDEENPHKKGLVMIFQQYQDLLKNMGVREIDAQGKPFDPERHNAVMHIEDETLGENVVAQVFQAGFLLGDRVLRHATVQVAN